MIIIGLIQRLFGAQKQTGTRIQLVSERGNGFYAWDGKIYQSDIVRACIRPKVQAIGKLVAKHIRQTVGQNGERSLQVNPEPYIRFLLEEPNPYMSGQKLQEKLATQLCLNNNAFALVVRDDNGLPAEIYPIPALSAEAVYANGGVLFLRFILQNGKTYTFPYSSIIHLRQDYGDNDIFGTPIAPALTPLMQIITTMDQGVVKAIKNSSVIRWLLKFTAAIRPEDVKKHVTEFAESFMDIENGVGAAGTNANYDAIQVHPDNYVPNADLLDRTVKRIYSLLGTNENIVQSKYTEDEWNAYYEAEIEPVVIELKNEFTRKLFTRRERGCGNTIVFEAANLATASAKTKLNLAQMVDRGAMTPNEWRAVLNLAPLSDGDKPVRRLDTAVVNNVVNALLAKMDGTNDQVILAMLDRVLWGKEVNETEN